MHGKRPTEFIKVMHFALSGKSGDPINMQTLQPREGLYLLQIPDQAIPVRRFVWDAFSVILSGIELNEEEFFIRDYMYMMQGLHHLVAKFQLLTTDGAVKNETYRWRRRFFVDPIYNSQRQARVVFQKLIAKPDRRWKSCLEWDDQDMVRNGIFVAPQSGSKGKSIFVMFEPEKMSPLYISEALDRNENQFVWLTSSIAAVFKKLSAACLEGE